MTLNYDSAQSLFREGRFVELVGALPSSERAVSSLSPGEFRLLVALGNLYTGRMATAESIARANNVAASTPAVRSRCELVLGLIAKRRGRIDLAVKHLQGSVR